MEVDTCLEAHPLEKLQIRFPILGTEILRRIITAQVQAHMAPGNAMSLEYLADDLRHRAGTEYPLSEALRQASQLRPDAHPTASAMTTLYQLMKLPMDTSPRRPETQPDAAVQQASQVQGRVEIGRAHV